MYHYSGLLADIFFVKYMIHGILSLRVFCLFSVCDCCDGNPVDLDSTVFLWSSVNGGTTELIYKMFTIILLYSLKYGFYKQDMILATKLIETRHD